MSLGLLSGSEGETLGCLRGGPPHRPLQVQVVGAARAACRLRARGHLFWPLTWKVGLEAGERGMSKGYRRGWTAPLLSPRCGRDQPEMEAHCRPGAGCSLPLGLLIPGYASEGLRPDVSDLCDSLSNLCPWRWRAGDCWLQSRKRACGGGRGRARLRCFRMFLRNSRPEADVRPSCLGGRGDRSQGGDFPRSLW